MRALPLMQTPVDPFSSPPSALCPLRSHALRYLSLPHSPPL